MEDKIIIECECGTHLLRVESDIEMINQSQFRQEICLAMFNYGLNNRKYKWLDRIIIAFNFLKTGKMHADQITLSFEESDKLRNFLNEKIITPQ